MNYLNSYETEDSSAKYEDYLDQERLKKIITIRKLENSGWSRSSYQLIVDTRFYIDDPKTQERLKNKELYFYAPDGKVLGYFTRFFIDGSYLKGEVMLNPLSVTDWEEIMIDKMNMISFSIDKEGK